VLNVLTGNLDRPGGAMFTTPAAGRRQHPRHPRRARLPHRRHASRVAACPRRFGELPVVAWPRRSTPPARARSGRWSPSPATRCCRRPNSGASTPPSPARVHGAVDIYLNETTRHADVILPAPSALEKGHYDLALLQLALRNVANYSEPVLPLDDGQPDEWEVLARLALIAQGQGPTPTRPSSTTCWSPALVGPRGRRAGPVARPRPRRAARPRWRPTAGPSAPRPHAAHRPYGDGFGADPDGLSLDDPARQPHGVDLGPLEPRLPEVLRTPTA
jgi:hypothetical protein